MGIIVYFQDGSRVEYPSGVIVSLVGELECVLDSTGMTIAAIPKADYKGVGPA